MWSNNISTPKWILFLSSHLIRSICSIYVDLFFDFISFPYSKQQYFSAILFLFRISAFGNKVIYLPAKMVLNRINATTKTLHQKHEREKWVRSKSSSLFKFKHTNNKSDHDECSLSNYFVQLIQFGCGEKEIETIGQINIAKRNSKQIQHSIFSPGVILPMAFNFNVLRFSICWANGIRTM